MNENENENRPIIIVRKGSDGDDTDFNTEICGTKKDIVYAAISVMDAAANIIARDVPGATRSDGLGGLVAFALTHIPEVTDYSALEKMIRNMRRDVP